MANKTRAGAPFPAHNGRPPKGAAEDLDLSGLVELVAVSVKKRVVRCRLLGTDRVITFRADRTREVAPGEILTIKPRKQWLYGGDPYLSGDIESTRLDVARLGLVPLRLAEGRI